jgi:hypothetical protein
MRGFANEPTACDLNPVSILARESTSLVSKGFSTCTLIFAPSKLEELGSVERSPGVHWSAWYGMANALKLPSLDGVNKEDPCG